MWYIFRSGTDMPGLWVARTARSVGAFAVIVDGPFATYQEANRALRPGPYRHPHVPAVRSTVQQLRVTK